MFEALAVSQGVVRLAPGVGNVERGEQVLVEMSGDGFPLRLSVAFAGERDPVLDRLSNALMAQEPPLRLLRVAGGGDEARQALARGDARFALVRTPVSGPQADSGPLRNAFGQGILLVHRRTGLAVAPGNPRGITDPHGAEADGARLVNLVSECALRLDGVVAACGEEGTEKGVAACVAAGMADCGPCSEETALSLGLGFVPLGEERVELLFSTADEPVRDALVRAANGI